MRPAIEMVAICLGGEEEDGVKVYTETLTEDEPALMERMICDILSASGSFLLFEPSRVFDR